MTKRLVVAVIMLVIIAASVYFIRKYQKELYLAEKQDWYVLAESGLNDYFRCLDEEEVEFCIDNFHTDSYTNYYSKDVYAKDLKDKHDTYGSRLSAKIVPESKGYFINKDDRGIYVRIWFKTHAKYERVKKIDEVVTLIKERDKEYMLVDSFHYDELALLEDGKAEANKKAQPAIEDTVGVE